MKLALAALFAGTAAAFAPQEAGRPATNLNIGTPGASWGATLGPSPQASNVGDQQRILGQTRRTWQFPDINQELVEVDMTSDGRPMYADIQLWIGPDWTPMTMKTYSYDGYKRPLKCIIGTRNKQATIEVKNTGSYELPITCTAFVEEDVLAGRLPVHFSRHHCFRRFQLRQRSCIHSQIHRHS